MIQSRIETYRLAELVRKMDSGDIQIPEFQRAYRWGAEQAIGLFESIHKGFPIGQIVFAEYLEPKDSRRYFQVIDGAQRLRTLYRCMTRSINEETQLRLIFDLDTGTFKKAVRGKLPKNYIYVSSLLSSNLLGEMHLEDTGSTVEKFVSTVIDLHNRVVQYSVPVMVIVTDGADESMSIFMALNTTGQKLTRDEVERVKALQQDHPDE